VLVKRSVLTVGAAALWLLIVGAGTPASAQTRLTPSVELTAGFQSLHIPDETYPFGVNFDMSGPWGDHERVRWVGEFGMAEDHPPITESLRFYHLGMGVRFTPATRAHATPFFQMLGGAARAAANFSDSSSDVAWGPMFQPGVGVSVPINRFVSVIGQGDYRLAIFRGQFDNEFRLTVGGRFMLW
jgi:hypothetical protein